MRTLFTIASLSLLGMTSSAFAVDEAAAESLARKSGCFKCHAIDKKKDGPPYKEIAGKWKGKGDAEQKLTTHVTTSPKVKIDGKLQPRFQKIDALPQGAGAANPA